MSVHVSACHCVCLPVCLSICHCVCMSDCLSLYVSLSLCVCVCLSACLSACQCVCLLVCLSLCLCVCLSIILCVCVHVHVCPNIQQDLAWNVNSVPEKRKLRPQPRLFYLCLCANCPQLRAMWDSLTHFKACIFMLGGPLARGWDRLEVEVSHQLKEGTSWKGN